MKEKAAEAAKKYGDVIQKGYFDFSSTKKEVKKDAEENKGTQENNNAKETEETDKKYNFK